LQRAQIEKYILHVPTAPAIGRPASRGPLRAPPGKSAVGGLPSALLSFPKPFHPLHSRLAISVSHSSLEIQSSSDQLFNHRSSPSSSNSETRQPVPLHIEITSRLATQSPILGHAATTHHLSSSSTFRSCSVASELSITHHLSV
jgi:hypothetical protein